MVEVSFRPAPGVRPRVPGAADAISCK